MSDPQATSRQPIASRIHTVVLLAVVAVWAWLGAVSAARMRSHREASLIIVYSSTMIFEWLIVGYVAWGIRRRGGSLRQLIGGSWGRMKDLGRDVLVAMGFWLGSIICLALLALALYARPNVEAVRFLAPRTHGQMAIWLLTALSAGICEEIIFRGYLQRQFIALSGLPVLGILLSAAVFGAVHAYQGAKQTIILGFYGAMFGILAYRRRSLRPGMMAHAWQDTVSGLVIHLLPK